MTEIASFPQVDLEARPSDPSDLYIATILLTSLEILEALAASLEILKHALQPLVSNHPSNGPATSVQHTNLKDTLPPSNGPRGKRRTDPAVNYIQAYYALDEENKDRCAANLTLSQVAAACQMGPGQLSKAFKKERGESFKQHLLNHRLKRSSDLLRQGRPVKEVAYSLGFELSYFSRRFHRRYNMTPSEFRETHRCDAQPRVIRQEGVCRTTLDTPAPVS